MVCHSLLQWTTFCQTSPPWPIHLGWPHTAWLSFIELDKVVAHVTRLTSFLWFWFQCVCPLMPSRNTYRLTWVSLTLDVGYLFMAAPAKCGHCSLPWTRGISSRCPSWPRTWSSSSRHFLFHSKSKSLSWSNGGSVLKSRCLATLTSLLFIKPNIHILDLEPSTPSLD